MSALPHEHEFEAARGLPEPLPGDERIVWQGAPDARAVARRMFHLPALAAYFAAMLALQAALALHGGAAATTALAALLVPAVLAVAALGTLAMLTRLVARTTLYTITNRRVVMRIGIVLTVTYNLPFRAIESADLRLLRDGSGDIALSLAGGDRIAYLQLWPHARPWRYARPQPSLRCIADARAVAEALHRAVAEAGGAFARPGVAASGAAPVRAPAIATSSPA